MVHSETRETDGEPYVSVVIPTSNRRAILEQCLEALLHQTFRKFEVIVVDDGSTDETPDFLSFFAREHPTLALRTVTNPERLGANRSRNRGVREARGALIAFTDSDCIASPDWIEKLVAGFTNDRIAAVTALVEDVRPANIYERTFYGTHRLQPGRARRLVGGNMCVRRSLLLERPLDEDLRWGCDEEGLFLSLKARGLEQIVVPDARVRHIHPYDRAAFFRQAYAGGGATARFVYKYHLPPRLDLLPFLLSYLTLPLIFVRGWLWIVPAFFFGGALAAISYNELFRKGKTVGEWLRVFPVLLAYYHLRLIGYFLEAVRLRIRRNEITRIRRNEITRVRLHKEASGTRVGRS